ncbi:hypothetical protein ACQY0O_007354 [Thecaphora frezii]
MKWTYFNGVAMHDSSTLQGQSGEQLLVLLVLVLVLLPLLLLPLLLPMLLPAAADCLTSTSAAATRYPLLGLARSHAAALVLLSTASSPHR